MVDNKKEELKVLLANVQQALKEAETFAEEHKLSFYYDGPAYGMGGWFEGDPDQRYDEYGETPGGWSPSSGSC